jgi:hypothetical protein
MMSSTKPNRKVSRKRGNAVSVSKKNQEGEGGKKVNRSGGWNNLLTAHKL